MRKTWLFLLLLSISHLLPAQIESLVHRVEAAQLQRKQHFNDELREKTFAEFDAAVKALFASKDDCAALFDRAGHFPSSTTKSKPLTGQSLVYGFMNHLVACGTDRVNVYSWDNLDGGSGHSYTNYLQYLRDDGTCYTIPIDTADESHQVGYYRIEQLESGNRERYLLFGHGSYGGGMQHYLLTMYEVVNGQFRECNEGFPEGKALFLECMRVQEMQIDYDARQKCLSFQRFKLGRKDYFDREFEVTLWYRQGKWSAK